MPVLVFDQFEELFTLGAAAGAQRDRAVAFMSELAELVENRPSEQLVARLEHSADEMDAFDFGRTDYRVCIALREDYLPHLEGLKTIMPALMENRMRLARMTGVQALEAVVKPGGALVTPEVAQAIVEFVSGARGGSIERLGELDVEPPLLSVICRELNERRRALGQAQITADLVSGNRREILTDFYERSVVDVPAGMRAFVEDHLLTKSGFRDNLALETALEFPGVTRPLIDTLVSRRLLRIEDRLGVQRVELTHDVLAEVIRAARDARKQRLVLAAATRHARRQRWLIAGLAVAVLALSIGAIFGLRAQRLAAQRASRTDVLYASRLLEEGKVSDGLAYLVRASRKDPANSVLAPRLLTALVAHNFFLPEGPPLTLPSRTLTGRYSADGREVFVQGEGRVIRVIDAQTWQIVRELRFAKRVLPYRWALAEKNERVLAVVLEDNSLLVCDAATGGPKFPPLVSPDKPGDPWRQFSFSPDGRWLVAGKNLTANWVWDTDTGLLRTTLPDLNGFAISADSHRIAARLTGKETIHVFTLPDGEAVGKPFAPPNSINRGIFFNPDGSRVLLHYNRVTGPQIEAAAFIQAYDIMSGETVGPALELGRNVQGGQTVQGVAVSPDGRQLAVSRTDRTATILDLATGKLVFPPLQHGGPVYNPAFSRDGSVLFTNCVDGLVRLWDANTGKPLAESTLKQDAYTPAALAPDGTRVAIFADSGRAFQLRVGRGAAQSLMLPRGPAIVFAGFMAKLPVRQFWLNRDHVKVIDIVSGRETEGGFHLPAPMLNRGGVGFRNGQLVDEGSSFVAFTMPNTTRVWTVGPNGIVRDVPLEGAPPNATLAWTSPLGTFLAVALRPEGKSVIGIWELSSGKMKFRVNVADPPSGIVFSHDVKRIAYFGRGRNVHVCELATGKELFVLPSPERARLVVCQFSPDGKRLVTGDNWGGVQFWDAENGKLIRSAQPHRDETSSLDFSNDGRYLVSSSWDGTAQVWSMATDSAVGAPIMHAQRIRNMAFSPDGTRVLTSSDDGTARLWDARSGQPLTEPMRHPTTVTNVSFSPDGRFASTRTPEALGAPANRIWPLPREAGNAPPPKWLLQLATLCAGKLVTDEGDFVSAADELAKMDEVRRELAVLPDDSPYVEWGRWFLSDSPARPIAPGFTITPAEAKKLAEEMAKSSATPLPAAPATPAPAAPPRP